MYNNKFWKSERFNYWKEMIEDYLGKHQEITTRNQLLRQFPSIHNYALNEIVLQLHDEGRIGLVGAARGVMYIVPVFKKNIVLHR